MQTIITRYLFLASFLLLSFGYTSAQCTIVDDFEPTTGWPWSPWVNVPGTGYTGTYSTTAHSGAGSIDSPMWHYRNDVTVGNAGDVLSCWTYFTRSGRSYMGFSAGSGGCWSAVLAPNTNQLIIQRNTGYGYSNQATSPQTYPYNRWYKTEVVWNTPTNITVNLYDESESLINSISGFSTSSISPGGVAIRCFSPGNAMDQLSTGSCSGSLPTQIMNFEAALADQGIAVSWLATSEISDIHYILEKSTDGEQFTQLEEIEGKGGLDATHAYKVTDMNPAPGKNIYRLSQVDANGAVQKFGTTFVNVTEDPNQMVSIYPNPANDIVYVKLSGSMSDNANLTVTVSDMMGRSVRTADFSGQTTASIELEDLKTGVYLVSVTDGRGFSKTEKLVVR